MGKPNTSESPIQHEAIPQHRVPAVSQDLEEHSEMLKENYVGTQDVHCLLLSIICSYLLSGLHHAPRANPLTMAQHIYDYTNMLIFLRVGN